MARLIVLYNPLDTTRRRLVDLDDGVRLLDWLDEHEPAPGRTTREVWLNGQRFTGEGERFADPEYLTQPGDEILVTFKPAWVQVGYFILQALISAAIGYVLNRLFGPKKPKAGNTPSPSQVYGIAPPRNAARLGEPIPVFYGSVIVLPDYAAQPYTEYENNEQFLFALLCLGQGECIVHEMILGDSSATPIPPEVATFTIFGPADHASTFGTIAAATGVRENVMTTVDVSDQELLAPNATSNLTPSTWYWRAVAEQTLYEPPDPAPTFPPMYDLTLGNTLIEKLAILPASPAIDTTVDARTSWIVGFEVPQIHTITTFVATAYDPAAAIPPASLVPPPGYETIGVTKWIGPFETCKAGQSGTSLELDFVFGNGLYTMDNAGNIGGAGVVVTIEYQPINDAGATTGPAVSFEQTFTGQTNTALRFTRKFLVPQARYLVRVSRLSNSDGRASTSDRMNWTGLKFDLAASTPATGIYGDVTLAAIKVRASNGVASDAASSVRFRVTRKLPPPAGGALAATVNPADVFADIVCAAYGGNRPRNGDELDLTALNAARVRWASHNGFNAVFDQPSTVWEALSLSVQTVSASPLPVGSRLSLIQDGVQPVRTQMFTDANIEQGTLTITHAFDRDGTPVGSRVEYRDPRTFSPAALFDPIGAPDYETISLFGCTSAAVAQEHATLEQNRRALQRTTIAFSTELEGLNCLPGDRIGVQASMPRWAQAATIVRVQGLLLTLDNALDWSGLPAAHALQLRDPQGRPHVVHGVTQGPLPYQVIVPSLPFAPRTVNDGMEPTSVSFGIDGQEITDWSVTVMQPQGDTVAIQAVNYDPAVWAGAGAHLIAQTVEGHL